MKQLKNRKTLLHTSTTSALSCFDALAKEGKHTCIAHCFHNELVTIPAKLRTNIIHFVHYKLQRKKQSFHSAVGVGLLS